MGRLRYAAGQNWRHHASLGRLPHVLLPHRAPCDDHPDRPGPGEKGLEELGHVSCFRHGREMKLSPERGTIPGNPKRRLGDACGCAIAPATRDMYSVFCHADGESKSALPSETLNF